MNIINRVKNIWKLGEFEPNVGLHPKTPGDLIATIIKSKEPRKMAQIIKRQPKDPIDEIVNG